MGRGRGGRYSGGRSSTFDVSYNLELFSFNDEGEAIRPTAATSTVGSGADDAITTYTFSGAIENFTGGYSVNSTSFEEETGGIGGILDYEAVRIFNPLTLDFTARYLPAGNDGTTLSLLDGTVPLFLEDRNGDGILNDEIIIETDRIEYILNSPELEARGINEFALYVVDEDPVADGFQLNGITINTTNGTNNIESILDVLSSSSEQYRISSTSETGQLFSQEGGFDEETIIIEAEDLTLDTYLIEDFGAIDAGDGTETTDATGISLLNAAGETGTASLLPANHDFSGTYDLEISYFDENDGEGQLEVLINDTVVGELVLNEATSSGFPTEDTRREYVIEDLDIDSSDTITIKGTADINDRGSEWVRIDDISFSPQSFLTNSPPAPLVLQAEDLDLNTYVVEDLSTIQTNDGTEPATASVISLLGATGETGTASLNASDPLLGGSNLSGIYDLGISYFDENDGEAQIKVLINGELARDINNEIVGDDLLLNANTSSGFPTEDTRREFVFEDLLIRPEDTISIRGIADINDQGNEWARIDSITFAVDTAIRFDSF